MRHTIIACCLLALSSASPAAGDYDEFEYQFTLSLERSALEGVTLGDDPQGDRLVIEEYELELDLEYALGDDAYLFFVGTLVDDSETLETAGNEEESRGLEVSQIGFGYLFGETVASELSVGRMEFLSASEWWVWWDEELDAVRLQSSYASFSAMLALSSAQAPELTSDDFIDPEEEDLRRALASLAWHIDDEQALILYYLDQVDESSSYRIGEVEDIERVDEQDADLAWIGVSYLGEFDLAAAGVVALELHAARVEGDETLYGFEESGDSAELEEIEQRDVEGSAQGILLRWSPAQLPDWTLVVGNARGSGDSNPDDGRDRSFRGSGLQGDNESFGELYQPGLSNLEVDILGIAWEFSDGVELALIAYDYRQRELAEEMRDVSIDLETTGLSRDLGQEFDLVLTVEARAGMELVLTMAEFDAGRAYGDYSNETSTFIKVELDYEF